MVCGVCGGVTHTATVGIVDVVVITTCVTDDGVVDVCGGGGVGGVCRW